MSMRVFKREARIAGRMAVIALAALAAVGTTDAQQRPRSQADSRDPVARGTTRQTVAPGGEASARDTVAPGSEGSQRTRVTPGGEGSQRTRVAPGGEGSQRTSVAPSGEGSSRRPSPQSSDDAANPPIQSGKQPEAQTTPATEDR